MLNEMKL